MGGFGSNVQLSTFSLLLLLLCEKFRSNVSLLITSSWEIGMADTNSGLETHKRRRNGHIFGSAVKDKICIKLYANFKSQQIETPVVTSQSELAINSNQMYHPFSNELKITIHFSKCFLLANQFY